jgi:sporulation protein YlmC with PRC-barrel domain
MRKKLIATMAFCAAVVLAAQGQTSSSSSPSTTDPSKSADQSGSASSSIGISGSAGKGLSATGRASHQEIRASQLTSADVKSTSGETLGTISDVIINPNSGRVEFAILSLSGSAGGTSSPGANSGVSSSTSGLTPSQGTSASSAGKQVAVPWSLIRAGNEPGSASSTLGQSFVFNGEATKLQSAPTFDTSTDLQGSWRQSVFSHFGVSANSATGGSESYGGRSYGTSSSGASTSPGSSGTTPDPSSSPSKQP